MTLDSAKMRLGCVLMALVTMGGCEKAKTSSGSGAGSAAPAPVAHTVVTPTPTPAPAPTQPAPDPTAPAPAGHPAPAMVAKRDPAAAKAANARGMQLLTAKKYKDAMAEFGKAIAADPDYVLAHYNLACAASRAQDHDVAYKELSWIGGAATWDAVAANAAKKAPKDPDLQWIMQQAPGMQDLSSLPEDLLNHETAFSADDGTEDPTDPSTVKLLATASGKHDTNCDRSDANQKRVLGVHIDHDGKVWLYGSLADGAAVIVDNKIVSRTEPFGCTGPGASQDRIDVIHTSNGAAYGPLAGQILVVVEYSNGGRRDWTNNVAVVKVKDKQVAKVFDATVTSSDDSKPGTLILTPFGDIVLGQPGAKQKRVFRFNAATSKFQEVKVD